MERREARLRLAFYMCALRRKCDVPAKNSSPFNSTSFFTFSQPQSRKFSSQTHSLARKGSSTGAQIQTDRSNTPASRHPKTLEPTLAPATYSNLPLQMLQLRLNHSTVTICNFFPR